MMTAWFLMDTSCIIYMDKMGFMSLYLRFKSFLAFSDKKQQPFPTKNEKNNNNNTAQSLPHQD